jgi:mannose-6-phosphate isomerase class I
VAAQPFSVVPYFDSAPWGGQWMKEKFGLDPAPPNYGWCFNCVPEENSLLLKFGAVVFETPSINVIFYQPVELLGAGIYREYGAEFPIRFDYLDTMGGGHLSFQVHPLKEYIREQFGMAYTQDESYYMMDAAPDGCVYLGLKEGVQPQAVLAALTAAQAGGPAFDADRFANKWPAKKHDHFLIPAGTVHCSGGGGMVLEISATPYIFTFKLWDWGRVGLDGRPRPIHLNHGAPNIQWDRTTAWVKKNLINAVTPVAQGDGWREEQTGLHAAEPLETRRHWFHKPVPMDTRGTVHVLTLVDGEEIVIESPTGAFAPAVVRYGECIIVPAAVGKYTMRPQGPSLDRECATMLGYARVT